jgi:hypothetical protein
MSGASEAHMNAMRRVMKYCVGTPNRGLELKPTRKWDGKDRSILIRIHGMLDSEYAKDPCRKSTNGWVVCLEDAPISVKSILIPIIALFVTEAERFAAVQCAQDMMHAMRIMESIGLNIEKPMKLFVDNKGAVDITHNWSVGGRTRNIEVKQYYRRELKELGIIEVIWMKGKDMTADVLTKNLPVNDFERHNYRMENQTLGNRTKDINICMHQSEKW